MWLMSDLGAMGQRDGFQVRRPGPARELVVRVMADALWGTIDQHSIMCMTSLYHSMGQG